jgi:hypothetical protein
MFCPQCGLESQAELKFCRSCGANLKVIGKAVILSEAIARSDGVPAKIKEMVQNLKVEKVTEEVSRAMDKMNREIERTAENSRERRRRRKEKTAAERRESMLTRGFIKLGSGAGFMLFLYFFSHAIVLRLDPDTINKVPFDIPTALHMIWLIGLIPVLSGLGHLFAGLTIKPAPEKQIEFPTDAPLRIDPPILNPELQTASARQPLTSVTERTTNILDRDQSLRKSEAR